QAEGQGRAQLAADVLEELRLEAVELELLVEHPLNPGARGLQLGGALDDALLEGRVELEDLLVAALLARGGVVQRLRLRPQKLALHERVPAVAEREAQRADDDEAERAARHQTQRRAEQPPPRHGAEHA